MIEINQLQKDALEKSANVGISHASTSLSKLFGGTIDAHLFVAGLLPIKEILDNPTTLLTFEHPSMTVITVYLEITGDINGASLLIFPKKSALALLDLTSGEDIGATKNLSLRDKATLGEVGTTLTFAYLTALNEFLELDNISNTLSHTPTVVTDVGDSILDVIFSIASEEAGHVLVSEIGFIAERGNISGTFILAFDGKSMDNILGSVNRRLGVSDKSIVGRIMDDIKRIF